MRKNVNKLATLALSGMMVMSMAMPAFAQDVVFHKILYTDGKTLAPATEFDFAISPATAVGSWTYKGSDNKQHTETTKIGPVGGVTVKQKAKFEPDEDNLGSNKVVDTNNKVIGAQFESDAKFEVHENLFTDYGIYEYDMKEKDAKYEGIVYAPSEFKIYVMKYRDEAANKDAFVTKVVRVKDGKGNAVNQKTEEISNNYGRHTPPENPDTPPETTTPKKYDSTHDVIITKNISGAYGKKTQEFTFQITVIPTDTNGVTEGKKEGYHVEEVGGTTLGFKSLKAGEKSTAFTVTQDKGIHIFGLTEGDKIVVNEGANEYTMTVKAATGKDSFITTPNFSDANKEGDFKLLKDDAVVIVDNNKGAVTPTGIVMSVAPYALMLAVAGGLGVVFFNRKKEEE